MSDNLNFDPNPFEDIEIDENESVDFKFTGDVTTIPAEQLCDVVIGFQYLGIAKDHAILCMTELTRRRAEGDSFKFEEYIKQQLGTLPKISETSSILSSLGKNLKL